MLKAGFPHKTAVLGAGVMGAQIAAHLANARVDVILFDLAPPDDDPNANVTAAIARLAHIQPPPLAAAHFAKHITPANYRQHLDLLRDCDLIIETISEDIDHKQGFYARIAPFLSKHCVITSNTSGISINQLAQALPESRRVNFCGMQFFNPPRYRRLVELVPNTATDPRILDALETFLVSYLGKNVIRAQDTPNFIANRIGIFCLLTAINHADRYKLRPDLVDLLVRAAFDLPKGAIFGLIDRIGLDIVANVIKGAKTALPDDPWLHQQRIPDWFQTLIHDGALGLKTERGIYRQVEQQRQVIEPLTNSYCPANATIHAAVKPLFSIDNAQQKFLALRALDHPQAQFIWSLMRDVLHYCAIWLADIAASARELDLAMRWGFGWPLGPFELWQTAGWSMIAQCIQADVEAQLTTVTIPLPGWVNDIAGVHCNKGSYSPQHHQYQQPAVLPVYQRHWPVPTLIGATPANQGETIFAADMVRLWHDNDNIAVINMPPLWQVLNTADIAALRHCVSLASERYQALLLWQPESQPTARNTATITTEQPPTEVTALSAWLQQRQALCSQLRYSPIPVVAAVQGLLSGYGCELVLHCDRVVAALETYFALTDALPLPIGGSCTELLRRTYGSDEFNDMNAIRCLILYICTKQRLSSAEQARQFGLLLVDDIILHHPNELLYVAKIQARALSESCYRPPLRVPPKVLDIDKNSALLNKITFAEPSINGTLVQQLVNFMCGNNLPKGVTASESALLEQELQMVLELFQSPCFSQPDN